MKRHSLAIFFSCAFAAAPLSAVNLVSFFIRPYPTEQAKPLDQTQANKLLNDIRTPGKINKKILKHDYLRNSTFNGVFATYWGYLKLPDYTGLVTFVRKHQKPAFSLLITPEIKPIMMLENTVHHWELKPNIPAALYRIERKQDPETKSYFWDVTSADLPENNAIPLDTILLFAKPKNMFVPTGITLTNKNPQLLLPDIYAKKTLNIVARALYVLTIKHFFSSLPIVFKKESPTYYSQQYDIP